MKKRIMVLGTSSSVGKSTIATAFCKYFKDKGLDVSPYKALNISLNSYITEDGDEIGRSQVVQAEACNIEPKEYMNPILMKPGGGKTQVIARGKVLCTMDAYKYKEINTILKEKAYEAFLLAEKEHEMLVLEGSGGCAELNLRKTDIANMHTALKTNTPVILVADIEKGGVFASVVGTLSILPKEEKRLIKGIIINKFRGNPEFFKEGVEIIENLTRVKVLGVMPYRKLNIEEEDGQTDIFKNKVKRKTNIGVIKFPHMSNFTDLNYLSTFDEIGVKYVENKKELEDVDIIVIPGSKNTIEDLRYMKSKGFSEEIYNAQRRGKLILGICGGFQMLGKLLEDPYGVEGDIKEEEGLNLLPIKTVFEKEKITTRTKIKDNLGIEIDGYEIHNGRSYSLDDKKIWLKDGERVVGMKCDNVYGTYLHGVLDNEECLKYFIKDIEIKESYNSLKEKEYKKLKEVLEENIDMGYVEKIIEEWEY